MKHGRFDLLAVVLICTLVAAASAQGPGFRGGRGPGGGGRGPGGGGRGPDKDFVVDRDDFHFLLEHHDEIRREVKELNNGVETITESDDQAVAEKIQKHVAAMYERVERNRPIRMRDPLFAEIFRHSDKIKMKVEKTSNGVRVIETSDDEYVAKLIKSHANVVSRFANYGFEEAHKTHAVPGKPDSGRAPRHANEGIVDMVFAEFDRVFIPALALTNQQQEVPATKAMERLSKSWETRFVGHFHELFEDDSRWPRDVSRIAQAIALAQAQLATGRFQQSHEELEPVRDVLMDARRRNEVAYPLDALNDFHATMEAIVKPAMKMDVASMTELQIKAFAELAEQAEQQWQRVEQTEFDLVSYGKNERQQKQFPLMLRAERMAINQLNAALEKNDQESILKSARGLKPPFAKVYMFFGDFQRQAVDTTE